MSNDFISIFYSSARPDYLAYQIPGLNLISSAFEIKISVCKRGTLDCNCLESVAHNGNFLLKFVGLFAGSAISITKIRLRYVVPRPSCAFTLQSSVTQKMVFLVRVRYIIARYYVSSIQARYT